MEFVLLEQCLQVLRDKPNVGWASSHLYIPSYRSSKDMKTLWILKHALFFSFFFQLYTFVFYAFQHSYTDFYQIWHNSKKPTVGKIYTVGVEPKLM
jgi:hypothetical protein